MLNSAHRLLQVALSFLFFSLLRGRHQRAKTNSLSDPVDSQGMHTALLLAQHHVRRTKRGKSAHRAHCINSLNQILQPSLALLKYFGGDVSTRVANALVALLPQPTLVPTQGRGIQTQWETGRSLEGNNCSDSKSGGRTTGVHLPAQGRKTWVIY